MKTTAEMEIKISNARITNVNTRILPNGSCKLEFELAKPRKHYNNKSGCVLIEASKLSLTDDFMSYQPKTLGEERLKVAIIKAITIGTKDFYRPIMDPSYANKACDIIHYKAGESPATERSYNFWKETIKDSKWCFGTKSQYVAFLGILIKKLIENGWPIEDAWDAVCNNSRELGNYWDYENSKHEMELTGSVEICGFFDLANTFKLLADDEKTNCYWTAGGSFDHNGSTYPLADLDLSYNCNEEVVNSVPWFVCRPNEE